LILAAVAFVGFFVWILPRQLWTDATKKAEPTPEYTTSQPAQSATTVPRQADAFENLQQRMDNNLPNASATFPPQRSDAMEQNHDVSSGDTIRLEQTATPWRQQTDSVEIPNKWIENNPQMGTWKLNEAKSKTVPGMWNNSMVVYAEKGDKIQVTTDGVDKNGNPVHGIWVGKFDGKAYKTKGNPSSDLAAYRMVNDWTNDVTIMKNRKVVWWGESTVAKNGKSRTVTVHGIDATGKEFTEKLYYDKQ
jgi:hypothetical protein